MSKISVEMTEEEFEQYLLIKRSIQTKGETQTIIELAQRLECLAGAVYGALREQDESGDLEIYNKIRASDALTLAIRELY